MVLGACQPIYTALYKFIVAKDNMSRIYTYGIAFYTDRYRVNYIYIHLYHHRKTPGLESGVAVSLTRPSEDNFDDARVRCNAIFSGVSHIRAWLSLSAGG